MAHAFDYDEARAARSRRRLSQADVADALGVGRKLVMRWESGDAEPLLSQAIALAALYDIPLSALTVAGAGAD